MMLRDYSCGFQLFFFWIELKQHFQTICFRQTAILNILYVLIQCSIPSQGDPHKNIWYFIRAFNPGATQRITGGQYILVCLIASALSSLGCCYTWGMAAEPLSKSKGELHCHGHKAKHFWWSGGRGPHWGLCALCCFLCSVWVRKSHCSGTVPRAAPW